MISNALEMFGSLLGPSGVVVDPEELNYFVTDMSGPGDFLPICVLRPIAVEQLSQAITISSGLGLPIIPRGSGASYSRGYIPDYDSFVMIDMSLLNKIEDINEQDMHVTVQAGCTWGELSGSLKKKGLRVPFGGPLILGKSTIGGAISSNPESFSSAHYGSLSDSILGLEVILADGTLLETGSASAEGRNSFTRSFGPDWTGPFVGDCGAFGIKVRITLRLINISPNQEYISFLFDTIEDLTEAHIALSHENVVTEQWGFDPLGFDSVVNQELKVLNTSHSFVSGFEHIELDNLDTEKINNKVLTDGQRLSDRSGYSLHAVIDGVNQQDCLDKVKVVRRICQPISIKELSGDITKSTRFRSFAPVQSLLGPSGEVCLPVHGMFPLSRAAEVAAVTDEYFIRHLELLEAFNIKVAYFTAIYSGAFVIEPVFYWHDRLHALHLRHVSALQKEKYGENKPNPEARAAVFQLRLDLSGLWDTFGAVHYQIGRDYSYSGQLSSSALKLAKAFKSVVDPNGLMNPGVLGLSAADDVIANTTNFPEFPQDLLRDWRNAI